MDPESFVRGGPTLPTYFFFKFDEGRKDPNTTINGPSSVGQRNAIYHRPASETPLKWRFAGRPMMAQH